MKYSFLRLIVYFKAHIFCLHLILLINSQVNPSPFVRFRTQFTELASIIKEESVIDTILLKGTFCDPAGCQRPITSPVFFNPVY